MIRRPPRSTLFPYNDALPISHTKIDMHDVLLRIWEREQQTVLFVTHDLGEALTLADRIIMFSARPGMIKRSEEHTSELQSRQYLVCRLLLEKKNKIMHFSSN